MAPTLRRVGSRNPSPYLLSVRSSKTFILTTICVAVFTDIFLYGIIVPVIPFALSARAGVPQSDVQRWVSVLLAVYGAGLLVGSPLAGWYADRSSSRRLPLLIGLVALAGSTVMLCLARTIALLVVGRLLQGLAAAVVWTVGTALLVDTVGQREIGQILGYVSLSMSVGLLLAPLLGGIVYDKAGYYPVYYMAFALILVDIVLRLVLIEKKIACQWDVNETEAESEVVSTGSEGPVPVDGNRSLELTLPQETQVEPHLAAAAYEATPAPPPPGRSKIPPMLTLLASRRLLTALWGCIVLSSLMTAFDSVIPLFVQRVFGWNSVGAGLMFLAITVPAFASPIVGWLSDEYGPRWFTVGGFIFAIPMWVLLRLVTYNSIRQKVLLCALLTLIGVSLTLVMPPLMAEIAYVVEAKERERPGRFGSTGAYAQAYGLFIAAFAAGSLIGPMWAGYVENAAGWGTMSWSLGLFSFAGAVPCMIWTGGLITERNARSGAERAAGKTAILAQSREEIGDKV
ncbi:MFS transporter-like protein [Venustampulla echinocandica]|uniref:MFS transporter-like protein n=1 Tax=Venustampulla echinocandica TaxID=2656787 RepID=A0A370TTZ3_9HELO|nr:MFS transporter-like protein [Venustampulla echinocandica]RDL38980.1 MFS transporter-like protein [Venustampulla echinocandica]